VKGLRSSEHRREGLQSHSHDVVVGLLGRQGHPGRLGMEAQHPRPWITRPEPLARDPGPEPAGRAELRDLLKEVHVGVEEERQPGGDPVDRKSGLLRGL